MGVDSVAGYFWMKTKGYNVTPIHFNHKLREQNNAMETKFHELCDKTNEKAIVGYGENLQTEVECREARLNFYQETLEENSTILTAHHINDYVEGYLLNCFRGHPNHTAIPLKSKFDKFSILHPFLLTRKKDFVQFAERNHLLNYIITDETNKKISGSRRNWIRNFIVPEMEKQKLSLEKTAEKRIKKMMGVRT